MSHRERHHHRQKTSQHITDQGFIRREALRSHPGTMSRTEGHHHHQRSRQRIRGQAVTRRE
eukprot:45330-Eustigmatos_ZCMA.PRE.1